MDKSVSWKTCIRIGITAFVLYLCIYYWSGVSNLLTVVCGAATSIFIGIAIAFVLNILMTFYENHYFKKLSHKKFIQKSRRPVCITAAILTLLALVALIVWLVVPELIACIKFLLSDIPPAINRFLRREWVRELLPADIISKLTSVDWMSYVSNLVKMLVSGFGSAVNAVVSVVTSVVSGIITFVISLIFSIYLLSGKDRLGRQFKRTIACYVPERWNVKLGRVLSVAEECFRKYIIGQCTEAVVLGVLCTAGMLLFRFPYAGMVGALIGFTALIPIAGAYIGAGVGAIMILTESPVKALLFLVFIIVLQQLEGNLIYPKVVGKSIGLPAIWVLTAVTIGGGIAGILGMLLGVPIAATIYRLVKEDVIKRESINKK